MAGQQRDALFELGRFGIDAAALGARPRQVLGRRAERAFRRGKRARSESGGFAQLRFLNVARACRLEAASLLGKPTQHVLGLGDVLFLAGEVARGLRQPRLKLRLTRLGAGLFALERVALDAQAMQHRGTRRLLVAQGLKFLRGLGLLPQGLAFGLGLLGDGAKRGLKRGFGLLDMLAGRDPMKMVL